MTDMYDVAYSGCLISQNYQLFYEIWYEHPEANWETQKLQVMLKNYQSK